MDIKKEELAYGIIAIERTVFREEQSSVDYQKRRGRKYRRWCKVVYAVGTQSKLILAQEVGKGSVNNIAYWDQLKQ